MRTASKFWLQLLLAIGSVCVWHASRAEEEFLDPEIAFKLGAQTQGERNVLVTLSIAPGYYLYREQFKFEAPGSTLGPVSLPRGKTKFDETFQKEVETYRDSVSIDIPVDQATSKFNLFVTNQGCADRGLCYPPQRRGIEVRLPAFGGNGGVRVLSSADSNNFAAAISSPASEPPNNPASADDSSVDRVLREGAFWSVVGVFFLAGVALSLTPCVLPMLPILSSIIVGQHTRLSRTRGLALAISYSLGMSLVYTALGVAAGLAGEGLAAALQNPWVLGVFAAALAALAMSMFGFYELQLPSALTSRLSDASQRLPAGRFASVFAMGGVSALIVSPCVAAPLAGALVYLSQTRNVWLGGSALFALSAGMSLPLLLLGASAGALLPKAGGWMEEIKHFFGLLLLGVALWTLQSVLPAMVVLALWGALAIGAAAMFASDRQERSNSSGWTPVVWRRAMAAIIAICGLMQLVGAASGGTNPLQPLAHLRATAGSTSAPSPLFTTVKSVTELDAALAATTRPVMLDFYADWCVSCKEMERFTFVDPVVQQKLNGALLLKADVTQNNVEDRALLKRFQLFGPPGTIFFDRNGHEVATARVVGFQDATRFVRTLQSAGL